MEVLFELAWATSICKSLKIGCVSLSWSGERGAHHAAVPLDLETGKLILDIRCIRCGTGPKAASKIMALLEKTVESQKILSYSAGKQGICEGISVMMTEEDSND